MATRRDARHWRRIKRGSCSINRYKPIALNAPAHSMASSCQSISVEPVLLAVAERELDRRNISSNIRGMFDVVYGWLKSASVKQVGHNYALYDKGIHRDLLVRVGFPVSGSFPDNTYAELHAWCEREGLHVSSQSWEVYGDWQSDPSRLETGLYLRLE